MWYDHSTKDSFQTITSKFDLDVNRYYFIKLTADTYQENVGFLFVFTYFFLLRMCSNLIQSMTVFQAHYVSWTVF